MDTTGHTDPAAGARDGTRGHPEGGQHVCGRLDPLPFEPADLERSIGSRFRAQVRIHEGCLAVGDGERRLTYGALEAWAEAIAARLADLGCGPGSRVGLLAWQGAGAIAAMLGCLLAGSTYVPLDPDEPDIRLSGMLHVVDATAVVADDHHLLRAARLVVEAGMTGEGAVIAVDRQGDQPRAPEPAGITGDTLAYVHHTSGSTGAPKGVVDRHANVVHNVVRYTEALGISPADRLSAIQSPAFSGVVSSIFGALLNGAAVFPRSLQRDGLGGLADWVRAERITIYHSVPSIWRTGLVDQGPFPSVRVVRLEGDRALGQDVRRWRRTFEADSLLANGLGTTETGLCRQLRIGTSTVVEDGLLPVGHAIPDMEVTILDDDDREASPGTAGQIAVTSRYLALGYWGRDDLTAAAFQSVPGRPGFRRYRTGDLGRLRPDGCMEYLGRRDGLLKVSGHRVEPAEVEAALVAVPGIREAAVRTVESRPGEGRLAAWIVADDPFDPPAIRRALAGRLPPHLQPSELVRLDRLPLAANGKVDRSALSIPAVATTVPRPQDPLELRIAAIVAQALGRPVGPDDDFFEAGGDSLAAAIVLTGLEAEAGRPVPTSIITRAPTVTRLAAALRDPAGLTDDRGLVAVRATGSGAPLVLVHAHGMPMGYALLAHRLRPGRPVWTLDLAASPSDDLRVGAIAARHVLTLRAALPDGPYLLGGFCFGGVLALEMARILVAAGQRVDLMAILGVTPFDFPGIVPASVEKRWRHAQQPLQRLLPAIGHARAITRPEARAHLSHVVHARRHRLAERMSGHGGTDRTLWGATRAAFASYRPERYGGRATLLLPSWSTDTYTDDAQADWAGLAADVRVHVLPGGVHALLRDPVVTTVAELVSRELPG